MGSFWSHHVLGKDHGQAVEILLRLLPLLLLLLGWGWGSTAWCPSFPLKACASDTGTHLGMSTKSKLLETTLKSKCFVNSEKQHKQNTQNKQVV